MNKSYVLDLQDILRDMSYENSGEYNEVIYLLSEAVDALNKKEEDDIDGQRQ